MASTQHTPTELEAAGDLVLPGADELAGRFPLTPNPHPATPEEYNEIMSTLAFGKKFTDHMAHMRWTCEGGWSDRGVIPYGPLELTPGASVFHYCQSVFEGIKAYKRADGSVWTFRPGYNAARLNHSARRLALPELSREDFVASLVDYVRADVKWVPDVDGSSLYLRPFMFASEEFVGVHRRALSTTTSSVLPRVPTSRAACRAWPSGWSASITAPAPAAPAAPRRAATTRPPCCPRSRQRPRASLRSASWIPTRASTSRSWAA